MPTTARASKRSRNGPCEECLHIFARPVSICDRPRPPCHCCAILIIHLWFMGLDLSLFSRDLICRNARSLRAHFTGGTMKKLMSALFAVVMSIGALGAAGPVSAAPMTVEKPIAATGPAAANSNVQRVQYYRDYDRRYERRWHRYDRRWDRRWDRRYDRRWDRRYDRRYYHRYDRRWDRPYWHHRHDRRWRRI